MSAISIHQIESLLFPTNTNPSDSLVSKCIILNVASPDWTASQFNFYQSHSICMSFSVSYFLFTIIIYILYLNWSIECTLDMNIANYLFHKKIENNIGEKSRNEKELPIRCCASTKEALITLQVLLLLLSQCLILIHVCLLPKWNRTFSH